MSNHEVHSLKYGSEDVQMNGVTHSNTYPDMHIVGSQRETVTDKDYS